jgi:hypothetical protein
MDAFEDGFEAGFGGGGFRVSEVRPLFKGKLAGIDQPTAVAEPPKLPVEQGFSPNPVGQGGVHPRSRDAGRATQLRDDAAAINGNGSGDPGAGQDIEPLALIECASHKTGEHLSGSREAAACFYGSTADRQLLEIIELFLEDLFDSLVQYHPSYRVAHHVNLFKDRRSSRNFQLPVLKEFVQTH